MIFNAVNSQPGFERMALHWIVQNAGHAFIGPQGRIMSGEENSQAGADVWASLFIKGLITSEPGVLDDEPTRLIVMTPAGFKLLGLPVA